MSGGTFSVAGLSAEWIVLDGGHGRPYDSEGISVAWTDAPALPPAFAALRAMVEADLQAKARGEGPRNAPKCRLVAWHPKPGDRGSVSGVRLDVARSDTYAGLAATRLARGEVAPGPWDDLRTMPGAAMRPGASSPLLHRLSLVVVPITRDGYAAVFQRSGRCSIAPGHWSVVRSEIEPEDVDAGDLRLVACRATEEELGLPDLVPETVHLLSFGITPDGLEAGILAYIRLPYEAEELREVRSLGVQAKWEAERMEFMLLRGVSLAQVFEGEGPWAGASIVALVHTLTAYLGSSIQAVRALRERTRELPPGLRAG